LETVITHSLKRWDDLAPAPLVSSVALATERTVWWKVKMTCLVAGLFIVSITWTYLLATGVTRFMR
jgi:hypothetical protein